MTKYKTIDPNTGEEVELPLSLSPYEIMNIVYSFLISVKTPELHFYEEAQKELENNYNLANIVLGDGTVADTTREQFLASTFFAMGMKMGKTASWPIGEKAIDAIKQAKAPVIKGGRFSHWEKHEKPILACIEKYECDDNRLKYRSDPSKLTQKKAIDMIELETGLTVRESTFNGWLKRYRENNGQVFLTPTTSFDS
tara:strand:+ start:892 stop:1482 length:591 start_codon:yes stop_codon:yes gene_type:complete